MKENIAAVSRWVIVLVGIPAAMYLGKTFLVTFFVAIVLAMVFSPVKDWLINKGLSRGWAVAACTVLLLLFFAGMGGLLYYQVSLLAQDLPQMEQKASEIFNSAQQYVDRRFGIAPDEQTEKASQVVSNMGTYAAVFFGSFTSTLANFLLMFAYFVLLLSHRREIEIFILRCVEPGRKELAHDLIYEARDTASQYVWGMLKDIAALAVIYCIGFLIGGIKYPILLAVIAALFSFLPYIGNIIGGGLAAVLAALSGDPSAFLIVVGVMTIAQLIENYALSPLLVGNAVGLNPMFSIVSIIVLGGIWGIGGAIVALPLTGILRVIFKFSPHTLPVVELMGDDAS
ncbi:AI-2E family transporter [Persicitalea sp.]|uniref:AI-2E family transporter n=1 Tax=Persicitalea sp. TaxID=3100273 RepID=UPI0035937898